MLKKLAAVLLLAGLLLPYTCDFRPVTALWHAGSVNDLLAISIPALAAAVYILHELVPPIGRVIARYAVPWEIVLLLLYFLIAGAFVYGAVKSGALDEGLFSLTGVFVTLPLLFWALRRGTSADRAPLLLLTVAGTAGVTHFLSGLDTGDLEIGAWVATTGWVLATVLQIGALRATSAAPRSDMPRDARA